MRHKRPYRTGQECTGRSATAARRARAF
jgi:hypothetical protein